MNVRRSLLAFLTAMLLAAVPSPLPIDASAGDAPVPAAENAKEPLEFGDDDNEMDCTRQIKYDLYTQRKLDQHLHQIYMGYVHLIETYAWEGGMTQAQKITRLRYLKNYMQEFKKRDYQWCSEHEPDEWEEEWYNSPND